MFVEATSEQLSVINERGNCVVNANPGSGKTYTITQKIKKILPNLPAHRGIIAISFTNKASDELKQRCLSDGLEKKSSFFGTIDAFFLSEIVIPFGGHVFGGVMNDAEVVDLDTENDDDALIRLTKVKPNSEYSEATLTLVSDLYRSNKVILGTFGFLASYIFDRSKAAQRYLKSRYTHIFIDEYQDCDDWQHLLFLKLVELGLTGVAVGDLNQSIYAFTGRDSRHLTSLLDDPRFQPYSITINHRSHASVINYSLQFLSRSFALSSQTDEIRVYSKHVEGSEANIARWIPQAIDVLGSKYGIIERRQIAVLFKNRHTGQILARNIGIPFKPSVTTPLDTNASLWGRIFRKILFWVFSVEKTKYDLIDEAFGYLERPTLHQVLRILSNIEQHAREDILNIAQCGEDFIEVARLVFPRNQNESAIEDLNRVFANQYLIKSFVPAETHQVQMMTLHKAKGLEFDLVFHMNLYKYILPNEYNATTDQDRNLHYVGLTRARECCVLCTSTKRTRASDNAVLNAEQSPFLEGLEHLRINCDF